MSWLLLGVLLWTPLKPVEMIDLAEGVLAISARPYSLPVKGYCTKKKCHGDYLTGSWAHFLALVYAHQAMSVATFYPWLKPEDLLALAALETDFRPYLICEGGRQDRKGWDCGMTQVRASVFKGRGKKGRTLCNDLANSSFLAFWYAARELNHYRSTYCKTLKGWRKTRCVWNMYNQGPRYYRSGWHGRYYLRHRCYRDALMAKRIPRPSCRSL